MIKILAYNIQEVVVSNTRGDEKGLGEEGMNEEEFLSLFSVNFRGLADDGVTGQCVGV